ncbi:hypothetical protein PR202_ga11122 [Eleusine coracana subsp. coracana]|uniref:F-box domain-containing protein n=1 Tax=Eleusine coracana subsp. coracana TaxID=191504 RepID=A0AAV5C870_ELECO|nr:hypothetical protein PR202_ga11122 [Eleusine coracana subsp. coracana]
MAPPPPPPPELMEDAVGEILLRLPPDDPALLLRASLVCKPWRRLLTDPAFLRRYHADYIVWDPITGDEQHVPDADIPQSYFNAAVMCAAGAGCDHRDCHGGPFLVALVGTDEHEWVTYASLYSSESGEWCEPSELEFDYDLYVDGALFGFERPERDNPRDFDGTALIPAGDGLTFAGLTPYSRLHLWSLQMTGDPDQVVEWTSYRVIELDTLLPSADIRSYHQSLIGVAPGPD